MKAREILKFEVYGLPFFKFLNFVALTHSWIKQTKTRKKVAFWLFLAFMYVEITIHIGGLAHFSEYKRWYEGFPIIGKVIDIFSP